MARRSTVSPETRAVAAAWLARLRADDKSSSDERTFRAWLAQDPLHAEAFESVTEVWEDAGAAMPERVRPRPAVFTRRSAMFAGVTAAVAGGVFVSMRQSAYAGVYETAVGEQKHIVLTDGTQVFLDTDTRIRASYDSKTRLIDLERGRCNFHVMENDNRPFVVGAAAQRIVAGRTTFDVQREGDDICVVVQQGTAALGEAPDRTVLRAGDRLIARKSRAFVDRPKLTALLAWQTGQAVFENDSLAQAIHEMNRYSVVKLAADDPGVAGMRISGVYHVGDNAAFARSVAALLPVAVVLDAGRLRLVADQARNRRTE